MCPPKVCYYYTLVCEWWHTSPHHATYHEFWCTHVNSVRSKFALLQRGPAHVRMYQHTSKECNMPLKSIHVVRWTHKEGGKSTMTHDIQFRSSYAVGVQVTRDVRAVSSVDGSVCQSNHSLIAHCVLWLKGFQPQRTTFTRWHEIGVLNGLSPTHIHTYTHSLEIHCKTGTWMPTLAR